MADQEEKKKKEEEILKKQAAEQASPPIPPPSFITEAIQESRKADDKSVDEKDDELIASLVETDAWKALKKRINFKIDYLKGMLNEKVGSSDMKLEEVGIRYLIMDQAVGALQSIISLVEGTAEIMAEVKKDEEVKKKEGDDALSA